MHIRQAKVPSAHTGKRGKGGPLYIVLIVNGAYKTQEHLKVVPTLLRTA